MKITAFTSTGNLQTVSSVSMLDVCIMYSDEQCTQFSMNDSEVHTPRRVIIALDEYPIIVIDGESKPVEDLE